MKNILGKIVLCIVTTLYFACTKNSSNSLNDNLTIEIDSIIHNEKAFQVGLKSDNIEKIIAVDYLVDGELITTILEQPFTLNTTLIDRATGEHQISVLVKYYDGSFMKSSRTFIFVVDEGTYYQGGLVVYVDEDGMHGKIAALKDVEGGIDGKFKWAANGDYGAYDAYDGFTNTQKFATVIDYDSYAACACLNYKEGGYSDWYLPASEEINYMDKYKKILIPSRSNNLYWTSTQKTTTVAYCHGYGSFSVPAGGPPMSTYYYVRAFRQF